LPKKIPFYCKASFFGDPARENRRHATVTGYFAIIYECNKKLSGCNDWNYGLCHFQNTHLEA
jgi:hypothetical protein